MQIITSLLIEPKVQHCHLGATLLQVSPKDATFSTLTPCTAAPYIGRLAPSLPNSLVKCYWMQQLSRWLLLEEHSNAENDWWHICLMYMKTNSFGSLWLLRNARLAFNQFAIVAEGHKPTSSRSQVVFILSEITSTTSCLSPPPLPSSYLIPKLCAFFCSLQNAPYAFRWRPVRIVLYTRRLIVPPIQREG